MDEEGGPVEQAGVDLREGGGVVLGEFDAFPEFGGHVGALYEGGVRTSRCGVGGGMGVAGELTSMVFM